MGNSGAGTGWSEGDPANDALVSEYPVETRDLRKGLRLRLKKEHTEPATSTAGGEHKAGSAVTFIGAVAPTLRPDGVTALDTSDQGRLWWNGSVLKQWTGAAWANVFTHTSFALLRDSQSQGTR